MAAVEKGWVTFEGRYACRADGIAYLYAIEPDPPPAPQDPKTLVVLKMGSDFIVPEAYRDVMRALLAAEA